LDLAATLGDHPKYRLLELIGKGGMGAVYKAEHRVMQRLVALKIITGNLINDPAAEMRFQKEIIGAARLSHPNIVAAYDAEQYKGVLFLVMEFVEGMNLAQVVATRGQLPVLHSCEYVRQAALGLQHAFEKGMVHRDIKPQNLFRTPQGRVKILDFGLARFVSEISTGPGLTQAHAIMGTPDYVAPEQVEDARQADIRADIYSLGCTLYFLLTAQPPFPKGTTFQKYMAHIERTPQPIAQIRADLPADLISVLDRMMAKKPAQRFQTPIEVARVLLPIIKPTASSVSIDIRPAPERPGTSIATEAPAASPAAEIIPLAPEPAPSKTPRPRYRRRVPHETHAKSSASIGPRLQRMLWRKSRKFVTMGSVGGLLLLAMFLAYLRGLISPSNVMAYDDNAGPINSVAFSSDGTHAVAAGQDGVVRLWDVERAKVERFSNDPSPIRCVAISPNGQYVAAAKEGTLGFWHVGSKYYRAETFANHVAAFISDDQILSDQSNLEELHALKPGASLVAVQFKGFTGAILSVAVARQGSLLLSGGEDSYLRLWDARTGAELGRWNHGSPISSVALSSDGTRGLSGGPDKIIRLWDLATDAFQPKELRSLQGHTQPIRSVGFSPDGKHALSGSEDQTMRLWDLTTGKQLHVFDGHASVNSVAFHPTDSRRALSGSADGILRLWRLPE
jgi:serine/threonine protein kinase